MSDNSVEIHVRVKDQSAPGAAAVKKSGERAGRGFGEGVATGVDQSSGKQRDAMGRFVKRSQDQAGDGGERAGRSFASRFGKAFGSGDSSGMVGGVVGRLKTSLTSALQPTAVALATGFSASFTAQVAAGLASGAAKMAHGLGAVAALLPAAAGAGVLAFASLKVAVLGVGDALKAGLSGDTEKFKESLKGLSPAARGFAREVVGMRKEIDGLKRGVQESFFSQFSGQTRDLGGVFLPMVSKSLSRVSAGFGAAVDRAAGFLQTPTVVSAIRSALDNMSGAVANVTLGLGGLGRAFLPLVTVGSTFLPQLTLGFAGATDGLAAFTTRAAETGRLAEFIQGGLDKLRSLMDTARQVGRIFQSITGIGAKLFSGANLSGGKFLDTVEKLADSVNRFFETKEGGKVLSQILGVLRGLAEAFLGTLQKLASMIAPFLPQIAAFATAFANLKTAILDAIEPAVDVLLGKLLPALTSLMEWVTRNKPVLQGLLIGLFAAWAASAAHAAVATLLAALPFIALGVAIAALAALVIIHFDTIKRWIGNVFNWVKDHWPLLVGMLFGPFGIAVGLIADNWNGLVEFVRKLPGRVTSAAKGMFDSIYREARGVFDKVAGLLNRLPGPDIVGVKGFHYQESAGILGSSRPPPRPVRAHASGGIGGGLARVAERGRELLSLPSGNDVLVGAPQGTMVHPNGATERMLAGGGGVTHVHNWNIHGSIHSERDLIAIIRNEFNRGGFEGFR